MDILKECKCRSENGNCIMIGGFCTSIPKNYCEMAKELKEYKDLEQQGKLLKNPQRLKNGILERMKEFMEEYRRYSESSIDHFGGKADAMETAMRIVKAAFSDAMN